MTISPEQRRLLGVLAIALSLSLLIHAVLLAGLSRYHEAPRTEERAQVQHVTMMTIVHTQTPTPPPPTPPPPTPTPPPPTPTPPPTPPPTPRPTETPPPVPVRVVRPQTAPKAAHLHLHVPKVTTHNNEAREESHADTVPGTEKGTLAGKGVSGAASGVGAGGAGTMAAPTPAPASCAQPHREPGVDDPVVPEQPEGTEGVFAKVIVDVSLAADGTVVSVKLGQPSGNALLDQAAMDAAKRSKFHSERDNCVDHPGTYAYRVLFDGS